MVVGEVAMVVFIVKVIMVTLPQEIREVMVLDVYAVVVVVGKAVVVVGVVAVVMKKELEYGSQM